MLKNRLISLVLAVCMIMCTVVFLPSNNVNAAGYHGEFDLSRGTVNITQNGRYRVYGRSNGSNRIFVAEDLNNVYIAFDSVNIQLGSSNAPFEVGRNSIVEMELMGNNILTSTGKAPAIEVNKNEYECGELVIRGDGSLEATGGKNCPAIGGNINNDSGKIEIHEGLIHAVGGAKAAAIGGSYKHNSTDTKIYNGTITAEATGGGAAIGGGFEGNSIDLLIGGGKIVATSEGSGAAIGGGYRGNGGNLQIYGGDITASADEYAFAIGSGRYAAGSVITVNNSPTILAFTSKNIDAVEYDGITSSSMAAVVTGTFSDDYFEDDQKISISGSNFSKSGTMPKSATVMSFLVPSFGDYTVSANGVALFCSKYSGSSTSNNKETLTIDSEYVSFYLRPSCACEQTDIEFNISDIKLTTAKNQSSSSNKNTTQTITLSASGGNLKKWSGCPNHTGTTSAEYEYYIVSDPAKIAEIDGRKLKVTVKVDGVYNVVVGVKATAQDLVKTAEATFTVTKTATADKVSVDDSSINITKNGVYTIIGSTLRNTIKVDAGLDDVTIVLSGVTINLDDYDGTTASPIEIGGGSNVTLDISGGTTRLVSNDKGTPILIKEGTSSEPTCVTVTGTGKLVLKGTGNGACIGSTSQNGGANTKLYFIDNKIDAESESGYCIGGDKAEVFISENSVVSLTNGSQGTAPVLGKIITENYKTYKPAILVQCLFEKALEKDGDVVFAEKKFVNDEIEDLYNPDGNKINNIWVNDIPKDTTGFAVILKYMGAYTASLDTGAAYKRVLYEGTKNSSGEDYYVVDDYSKIFKMHYDECKCSISAPKLSVSTITIPYDKGSKSIKLNASGAVVKSKDDCNIHVDGREGSYSYSIIEDEDNVFSISGSTLIAKATEGGKYKAKIRVRAEYGGLTSVKEVSVSAEKLTKEDMEKKMGKEHNPYLEGDESGNFRPDDFITRAEVATLLSKVDEGYATAQIMLADFSDVKKSDWHSKYVSYMAMQNLVTGYEDGTFRPDEYMTRAEFATIACRKLSLTSKSTKKASFVDVGGHWAEEYITAMTKKKYLTGYEDKSFRPDNLITRAEAVVVINRLLDREAKSEKIQENDARSPFPDVKSSHWAYYDIIEATVVHFQKEFH